MDRKLSRLLFALALAITTLGGLFTPKAQASCTQHCTLVSCGFECCTLSDCSTHCFHVVCGN
jgi:hypothetical protein